MHVRNTTDTKPTSSGTPKRTANGLRDAHYVTVIPGLAPLGGNSLVDGTGDDAVDTNPLGGNSL